MPHQAIALLHILVLSGAYLLYDTEFLLLVAVLLAAVTAVLLTLILRGVWGGGSKEPKTPASPKGAPPGHPLRRATLSSELPPEVFQTVLSFEGKEVFTLGEKSVRVKGDVEFPNEVEVAENIYVEGSVRIGQECVFHGDVKVMGDVWVGSRSRLEGTLQAGGSAKIEEGVSIGGCLDVGGDVELSGDCEIGESVASGGAAMIRGNVRVSGKIAAKQMTVVAREERSELKQALELRSMATISMLERVAEILKWSSYTLEMPAKVKGRSGKEHHLDIYAVKRKDGKEHRIIVKGRGPVGAEEIAQLQAIARDLSADRVVVLAAPQLDEMVKKLAEFYGMTVVESGELDLLEQALSER